MHPEHLRYTLGHVQRFILQYLVSLGNGQRQSEIARACEVRLGTNKVDAIHAIGRLEVRGLVDAEPTGDNPSFPRKVTISIKDAGRRSLIAPRRP